ncbi:MAG TPA: peptidase [Thermoanaerobaculia bacterium]|nr:peptidase [Thermoanaerobaculia bacterium]HQR66780.1 peptidase [Thermoanaerobaculia bacterium]
MKTLMTRKALSVLLAVLALAAGPAFGAATITIVNGNAPGVGFNDPTPAAPVGGNSGTTLGQQRLNAFQYAAGIWGSTLDSNVEIQILATFEPLSCTATSAVLGSAGTLYIFANFPSVPPFPGPEFADTWYHQALANKRAGGNLNPGFPDLRARFNSNLGNPGCLTGVGWYLGFDGNEGSQVDLVAVLLHEFAHGLGFSQFASVSTGSQISGLTDVYGRKIYDKTAGKYWNEMTNAERAASAINPRRVVWAGSNVTAAVPSVLSPGTPLLHVSSPAAIVGDYAVGAASFGPVLASPGITGTVVRALDPADGAGPTTFDACSPLTNAAAVAGNIALVDRGTCGFVVKVKNAQNAGAIAVLVADNVAGGPPAGLGGADPTITIPSVRITLADGNTIKAQLGAGVTATLGVDLSVRAGADSLNRALLYTPNPVQSGSTISHWDTIAFPNQLMEPAINADLTHSVAPPQDLTLPQMRDVGWFPDADLDGVADDVDCNPHSDLSPTVVIDGCDSGVPNTFFSNGCTIADLVGKSADGARNHGAYVSAVTKVLNELKKSGVITGAQMGAIQSCAARAAIP